MLVAAQRAFIERIGVASVEASAQNMLKPALQHNPTYVPSADPTDKALFRRDFAQRVFSLTEAYRIGMSENDHVAQIVQMADELSADHARILKNGRLRIGTVQKALNIHLKTVWCLGPTFPEPPHCPVDRIVLQAAGLSGSWTQLDSIQTYQEWIELLREFAVAQGYASLGQWELSAWTALA
ncbi:MAG: hypothetical protein ACOYON_14980 [Fimbriimonas sp.]